MKVNEAKENFPRGISLHIVPGLLCNLACGHCGHNSSPKRTERLSDSEIDTVCRDVATCGPDRLIFTGGEPLLYIDIIKRIVTAHPRAEEVLVTTNGKIFDGMSAYEISKFLREEVRPTQLQLSWDRHHRPNLPLNTVSNIQTACGNEGIAFNICVSISEPIELVAYTNLRSLDCKLTFQTIEESGRAKTNGLGYKYPAFDSSVLDCICPNLNIITFFPGVGYTTCSSNLFLNCPEARPLLIHEKLNDCINSNFRICRQMTSFRETIQNLRISDYAVAPNSSACRLCEFIFQAGH